MADGMLDPRERQTLGALRYAVNEEVASYLAIMRLFTSGMSGFLSDQSAGEVAERSGLPHRGWSSTGTSSISVSPTSLC